MPGLATCGSLRPRSNLLVRSCVPLLRTLKTNPMWGLQGARCYVWQGGFTGNSEVEKIALLTCVARVPRICRKEKATLNSVEEPRLGDCWRLHVPIPNAYQWKLNCLSPATNL